MNDVTILGGRGPRFSNQSTKAGVTMGFKKYSKFRDVIYGRPLGKKKFGEIVLLDFWTNFFNLHVVFFGN
jgi:hypothetical protein